VTATRTEFIVKTLNNNNNNNNNEGFVYCFLVRELHFTSQKLGR